jgi:hypothetical protein
MQPQLAEAPPVQTAEVCCRVCGCTDTDACPGGCAWVELDPPLCSTCATTVTAVIEEMGDWVTLAHTPNVDRLSAEIVAQLKPYLENLRQLIEGEPLVILTGEP